MKDIPVDRLEDVYQFVHALNRKNTHSAKQRKKILSFAGSFGDMTDKDYASFKRQTKRTRKKLFDRNTDI